MTGIQRPARPASWAFVVALALAGIGINVAQAAPEDRPAVDTKTCSRPVYPEEDARNGNTGTVTMQFLLSADGRVIESKIQKSSGFRSLDEAALTALAKCRFRPPMVDGKAVQAWTAVQYVWTPDK